VDVVEKADAEPEIKLDIQSSGKKSDKAKPEPATAA